jgi:hypothetical protein
MSKGRSDQAAWLAIIAAVSAVVLLQTPSVVFAQATGTATIRGTVRDTSGGGVPGATVTLTNTGTNAVTTAVTDGRGSYQFIVFAGTYSIKVELTDFKTIQHEGIAIRPADTRGLDVRLEVGTRAETVTVTAVTDVIQTETGSREGVLTDDQIENLSVIGRSSLELLRILPGVVAPDASAFESVSFGGGANDTRGYTFNGIPRRTTPSTSTARRSSILGATVASSSP